MSVNVTDVPPLPFAGDGNGLSEYEAERLQNIAANQQFLR